MKIDGLPDDLNNSTLVKEAPDLATLVKTALNYQSLQGNSIRIPSDGASEADKKEFREKLGRVGMVPRETFTDYVRPEKPELYALTNPPTGADKVVTQGEIEAWKKNAHDLGLSPKQFESYATAQINARMAEAAARAERFGRVDEALKAKGGEGAKARALAAAAKFGGDELVKLLGDEPSAPVLVALAEVGKLFQERGMGDLTPRNGSIDYSPSEAALKLDEIMRNPTHPFNMDRMAVGKPAKEAALREVMNLRRIMSGERALAAGEDFMFEKEA